MPFLRTPPSSDALHQELHGDGPESVMIVMGFGCCGSYWHPLVELLFEFGRSSAVEASPSSPISSSSSPSSSSRYTVCVFDSRGFGRSGDAFAQYSSSRLATDVKALLMHLGWIWGERPMLQQDLDRNSERDAAFKEHQSRPYTPPPLHLLG